MSLLDNAMVECIFLDKIRTDDGEGGYNTEWREGATFNSAIVLDQSIQAQMAQAQGVTGVYTVTVRKHVRMDYHDVFRRKNDGQVFRVVSKDDSETPASAALNARVVKAEEWSLPT